ncbi:caspase domain-containing protein [Fomes fomentarius]|nr:caspase domain-containing protein [Fomes fomentarius]
MAPEIRNIFRQLSQPSSFQSHPSYSRIPRPIRRALIVGINYVDKPNRLRGAHDDAKAWRRFCIEKYGFEDSQITMMLDDESFDPTLQPTHANLLIQITRLPMGIQTGDELMFFYSGHSGQVESTDPQETDGLDECIIPLDYDGEADDKGILRTKLELLIFDNTLRKLLVDTLPVGTSLTAVFDSCHSGTLLDLDHYDCNAVWFPFSSRGPRQPKSLWQRVRRKDGCDMNRNGVRVIKKPEDIEQVIGQKRARSTSLREDSQELRVHQYRKVYAERLLSIDTALAVHTGENKRCKVTRSTHESEVRTPSLPTIGQNSILAERTQTISSVVSDDMEDIASGFGGLTRYTSPEPMEAAQCGNGGCCDQNKVPKPRVVSIAAAHNPESTFDTREQSMMKILIELLREDPHPPCRTLVQRLGLKLHGFATDIMKRNQARREKQKRGKKVGVYDVDFFVPQEVNRHL